MKILFASAELDPFSKVGGLADVAKILDFGLAKLASRRRSASAAMIAPSDLTVMQESALSTTPSCPSFLRSSDAPSRRRC